MPAAAAVCVTKAPPAAAAGDDLSRWHALCELLARMVVLPVVCVSICSAVGLLLGLECMEKLPPAIGAAVERVLGATPVSDSSSMRNQEDDGGDAARRPVKKQRASITTSRSSTSGFPASTTMATTTTTTSVTDSLDALIHKAVARKQPAVARKRRVLIWDLDETLVLFASLYSGAFALKHGKEVATGVQLGEQMMAFMLVMLERHFFFDDLHDADIDHIDCVHAPEAAPAAGLAARYERIREIYERDGAVDFLSDERSEWFAIRETLVAAIDAFSTGWLQEARHVLELLTSSSSKRAGDVQYENVNLLVTNTQLAPALCKCLIYELDAFFPIESVYSSSKVRKQHCFEQILRAHAGDNVEFVAIGDGAEEEHVSRALGIQFLRIHSLADLQRLRVDLQLDPRPSSVPSSSSIQSVVRSTTTTTSVPTVVS